MVETTPAPAGAGTVAIRCSPGLPILNPPRDHLDRFNKRLLLRLDDRHRTIDDLFHDRCKDGRADDPERSLLIRPDSGGDALIERVCCIAPDPVLPLADGEIVVIDIVEQKSGRNDRDEALLPGLEDVDDPPDGGETRVRSP